MRYPVPVSLSIAPESFTLALLSRPLTAGNIYSQWTRRGSAPSSTTHIIGCFLAEIYCVITTAHWSLEPRWFCGQRTSIRSKVARGYTESSLHDRWRESLQERSETILLSRHCVSSTNPRRWREVSNTRNQSNSSLMAQDRTGSTTTDHHHQTTPTDATAKGHVYMAVFGLGEPN